SFDVNGNEQAPLGGPTSSGQVDTPTGLAIDDDDLVYVADSAANTVSVLDRTHGSTYTVFAGTGVSGSDGDGGAAVDAKLTDPSALAWHRGDLYIGDTGTLSVRKVDGVGDISTVAGTGGGSATGDGGL